MEIKTYDITDDKGVKQATWASSSEPTHINVPEAVLSYPSITKVDRFNKKTISLIIDDEKILDKIKEASTNMMAATGWNGKLEKYLKGDKENTIQIKIKDKINTFYLDEKNNFILDVERLDELFYGGAVVQCSFSISLNRNMANKNYVSFTLRALKFLKHGEKLGGSDTYDNEILSLFGKSKNEFLDLEKEMEFSNTIEDTTNL